MQFQPSQRNEDDRLEAKTQQRPPGRRVVRATRGGILRFRDERTTLGMARPKTEVLFVVLSPFLGSSVSFCHEEPEELVLF